MPKTLIVPSSRVRLAPVSVREDGSTDQPPGTVLEADDGTLIGAVSSVTTGDPVEEDDSAGVNKRKAFVAEFSDAALATVKGKIAAAVSRSDGKLPPGWKTKKESL
jgi:uncharacterized Zn-binding protein involved in type VI secretion